MFAKKNVKNIYALTPLQEGILFHALYGKENATYFEQFNYHITGEMDVVLFEAAWNALMQRHDILRTMFVHKNVPQPLQIVLKKRKIDFLFENLDNLSPKAQRSHWLEHREKDKTRYFDLSKDVLMRLAVFKLAENSFNVTWSFHHIIMDGWCMGVVYEELLILYNSMKMGTQPELLPSVSFGEYVKWLKKQDEERACEYWRKYLTDFSTPSGLPRTAGDTTGEKRKKFIKKTFEFQLSETISDNLRALAVLHHVTVSTVIQMIWGILLGKYNNLADVVFASTVSGRPPDLKGVERIIGLFINAIPVRIHMSKGMTVKEILQKIHRDAAENKEFHYYSLAKIQAETTLKQNLLDHLLIFESYPDLGNSDDSGMTGFVIDDFEQFELTNYDLSIQLFPDKIVRFSVIYNESVYEESIIEKIEPHLKTIINAILADSEIRPENILVLSSKEQEIYMKAADDRNQALIKPAAMGDPSRNLSTIYAEPEDEAQEKLAFIWKEVMNIEPPGINDNFFELGGHSLMATRIVSRIEKTFDVEITLQEFFDNPNIKELTYVINQHSTGVYSTITRLPDQQDYALSHSQRRLWILDRMEEDFIAYNQSAGFLFKGELDIDLLKRAVLAVCQRHEALRTVFVTIDNVPRQKIFEVLEPDLTQTDLRGCGDKDAAIKDYAQKAADLPFDLEKGPLLRIDIVQTFDDTHLLLINIHHIICDGWSVVLFEKEVLTLYKAFLAEGRALPYSCSVSDAHNGHPHSHDCKDFQIEQKKPFAGKIDTIPPLKIQYRDYAAWHNRLLENEGVLVHQEYWHKKLSGELPALNLPVDYPRPAAQTYNGKTAAHVFGSDINLSLNNFSRENQVTLFMTLLAGVKILLHRYTGQKDIIIGSPVAGRIQLDIEEQIGFFVNTLALRDMVIASEDFMTLLSKVKQTTLEAYQHQVYPFDKLVEELDVQRDISRSPIFNVMMVMQNVDEIEADLPGVKITSYEYETSVSQFDLTLIFTQNEAQLQLYINYNTDLFEKKTIVQMGRCFEELMKSILSDPMQKISSMNILSAPDKKQILFDFNNTRCSWPEEKTLVDLFEEQVGSTPDNTALIFEDQLFTYRELNETANRLACYLKDKYQIQPEDLTGVIMGRSQWLIVSLLGILKAGGAYLPIDPEYPRERIKYMLDDSACKVLLTENSMDIPESTVPCLNITMFQEKKFQPESFQKESFQKDGFQKEDAGIMEEAASIKQAENPQRSASFENLAYVIYTSGSTGRPKGVMIEHGGFVNMILAQIKGFEISETDRVLQFASPSFDASLSEIFMALLKGAAIVIISEETINDTHSFIEYIERHQVSVVTFPPVYLNMLAKAPLPTVKTIITAGEPAILSDVLFYCRDRRYFNAYGPTETSVCTSFFRVPSDFHTTHPEKRIPIGKPIANSSIFIVDDNMQPLPVGVPGEICFAGAGTARGYLNRPELTAEKFIENPFHIGGPRLYKSGDLGKWINDGTVVFLGRKDDQVKIRGFRIELGEIESRLKEYPQIKDALVLTVGEKNESRQLAAYIIIRSETEPLSKTDLIRSRKIRNFLEQTLPRFMIPAHFISLEKFPLTVNGKIDKRALIEISEGSHREISFKDNVPPRNNIEAKFVKVWQKLFHRENISIYDDFFLLGGDSIKAIQAVSLLYEEKLKVKVKDIFKNPTCAELAKKAFLFEGSTAVQSVVTGGVKLTGITAWFFKDFSVDRHYFNHCELFSSKQRLDKEALRAAFTRIQEHHDALRMRCCCKKGEWKLEICNTDYPLDFEVMDLRTSNQAVLLRQAHTEKLQAAFELETGPLMKAVLFQMPGTTQPGTTHPKTTHPKTAQLKTAQPKTAHPETTQPGTTQPKTTHPKTTQLKTAQPKIDQPKTAQADSDQDHQTRDQLLIIVHHLVIDAVSWRFFMEDLLLGYEQFLAGKTISLPLKTDSFKDWAAKIEKYSTSHELLKEKEYWQKIETTVLNDLPWDKDTQKEHSCAGAGPCDGPVYDPLDDSIVNYTDDARLKHTFTVESSLSYAETEILLTKAGQVYAAKTDEILLTALAYSLKQWHGENKTLINLEGHGREEIYPDADISRTIGWFTSVYPVILDSPDSLDPDSLDPDSSDIDNQINRVKELIQKIPNRGMGYSILKYVTPKAYKRELKLNLKPKISFNYLGQFDSYETSLFKRSEESCGNSVSQNAKIIHDIDINALIAEKKLHLYFTVNSRRCRQESVEKIVWDFVEKLKEIIYQNIL